MYSVNPDCYPSPPSLQKGIPATIVEAVRLFKLKRMLNQKQAKVKFPQMPLIQVGQVSIPNCLENQGLLCVGSKKNRLNATISLMRQLKQRTNFRGIVLDPGGELLERFFDPALDKIFAPNDDRSIAWCHKSEPVSGEDIARSLIDINPADPFFYEAAIEVLATIFESSATSDEVWQKLNVFMPQDLQIHLFGDSSFVAEMRQEPMQVFFPGDVKFVAEMLQEPVCAETLMSIIKNVTQFYCYLRNESKFSFYDWGNNDDPGWVFIPWFDGNEDDSELMPFRQMAIDLALQGLLAQKEVVHHRTAVVIPDLSCLKPRSLPRFVMECRNRQCQGFPLLGVESVSSAIAGYGQQNTQLIFDCMQTKLLFNEASLGISNRTSTNKQNFPSQQGYLTVDGCFAKVKVSDDWRIA